MQGQSGPLDPFPGMEQGSSISSSSTTTQQTNNRLSPLSNYMVSSSVADFTCGNVIDHEVRGFSGWTLGEASSSLTRQRQRQNIDDETKMDYNWSPTLRAHAGADPRLDERRPEASDILNHERVHGIHATNGSWFYPSSSSSRLPHNVNLDAEYFGNGANCGSGTQAAGCLNLFKSEQMPSSADGVGTSSGSSGLFVEGNDGESSSSVNWGLSCKRKALEGTSRQSHSGGSSSYLPQSDNIGLNTVPARFNGNLNITAPPTNTPTGSPPEHLNPGIGVGVRSSFSEPFPSSRAMANANTSLRNLNRRTNVGHQQEYGLFSLPSTGTRRSSNAFSRDQSSRPLPGSNPLDVRSTVGLSSNASVPRSQSHVMHVPGFPRNGHPFPWSQSSSSRVGSSSSSVNFLEDRGAAMMEESNVSSNPRNNSEHPIFSPSSETRSLAQEPINWSLATGIVGNAGGVNTSQIAPGSGVNTLSTPGWISNHSPPAQTPQRIRVSDFSPWSFIPSANSEFRTQSGSFSSLSSGASASPQDIMVPSSSNYQGRGQLYQRSSFSFDRQVDDVFGSSSSLRTLAADVEGRHRFISEQVRHVLSALRRVEHLRTEDYMPFDSALYHGMADLHDRHRDMRLDVDNMTYEELLALGESIGDVKTGLSEEKILELMEQRKFTLASPSDMEPCCVCQEEYSAGDDLGTLACGHDFHTDCIKRWLMQKNLCPICKTTGLVT